VIDTSSSSNVNERIWRSQHLEATTYGTVLYHDLGKPIFSVLFLLLTSFIPCSTWMRIINDVAEVAMIDHHVDFQNLSPRPYIALKNSQFGS
jgi:hypothetical protein